MLGGLFIRQIQVFVVLLMAAFTVMVALLITALLSLVASR